MKNIFAKKLLLLGIKTIFISVFFFIGIVFLDYIKQKQDFNSIVNRNVKLYQNISEKSMTKVLGEVDETSDQNVSGDQYAIENLNVAGEALASMTNDEKNQKIEVSNVQGRVYKNEEEESLNYITSWQSNKPTISSVEYIEDEEGEVKKVEENSYSYIHNIVFPKVDFSSVYKYIIKSQDRWGNEIQTGQFVFYTGPEEISFFKLLEKSLLESFGWMASK
jgi:hypothetical protein